MLWHIAGRKTRYAYLATMPEKSTAPGFVGVTKLDLQANNEVQLGGCNTVHHVLPVT